MKLKHIITAGILVTGACLSVASMGQGTNRSLAGSFYAPGVIGGSGYSAGSVYKMIQLPGGGFVVPGYGSEVSLSGNARIPVNGGFVVPGLYAQSDYTNLGNTYQHGNNPTWIPGGPGYFAAPTVYGNIHMPIGGYPVVPGSYAQNNNFTGCGLGYAPGVVGGPGYLTHGNVIKLGPAQVGGGFVMPSNPFAQIAPVDPVVQAPVTVIGGGFVPGFYAGGNIAPVEPVFQGQIPVGPRLPVIGPFVQNLGAGYSLGLIQGGNFVGGGNQFAQNIVGPPCLYDNHCINGECVGGHCTVGLPGIGPIFPPIGGNI